MNRKKQIGHTIFDAIDELNALMPKSKQLKKSLNTVLFGKSGKLDSLGLVNLIVNVERRINDEFGVAISIADERAMSQKSSPFKSVETLADYISLLLEEKKNE